MGAEPAARVGLHGGCHTGQINPVGDPESSPSWSSAGELSLSRSWVNLPGPHSWENLPSLRENPSGCSPSSPVRIQVPSGFAVGVNVEGRKTTRRQFLRCRSREKADDRK